MCVCVTVVLYTLLFIQIEAAQIEHEILSIEVHPVLGLRNLEIEQAV